jgi:hypothetical protein
VSETLTTSHLDALRTIYRALTGTSVNWVVTGSLGFALQGLPVRAHDIDLQTDELGAYEIERVFAASVVRPVAFSEVARIRSHFGALRIGEVDVEIMGDIQYRRDDGTWDSPADLRRHQRLVELTGMHVPVLSLEYEYEAYLKMGRTERVEMIKDWMQRRTGS